MLKAVLFDLDGVISDTTKLHYQAWLELANKYQLDFNENINEQLKGVSRASSLQIILDYNHVTIDKVLFDQYLLEKNNTYIKLLDTLTENDINPGIKELLLELQSNNIKTCVVSASCNAPNIINKLGLMKLFNDIVDPLQLPSKPNPALFLKGCELVKANSNEVVAIEDAQVGIDAINKAEIISIAIDNDDLLNNAIVKCPSTKYLNYNEINKIYTKHKKAI